MNSKRVTARRHHEWCVLGKTFKCRHCDKLFASDFNKRRHERQVHEAAVVPMTCRWCKQKTYTVVGSLQSHERYCSVNPAQKERGVLKCPLCRAVRTRPGDMTTHMRTHQVYMYKPGEEATEDPEEADN